MRSKNYYTLIKVTFIACYRTSSGFTESLLQIEMSQRLPINPGLHLNKIVPPTENLNTPLPNFYPYSNLLRRFARAISFEQLFKGNIVESLIISSTTRHPVPILLKWWYFNKIQSHVRGTAATVPRKHFVLLRLQIVSIKCSPNRNLAR